MFWNVTRDLVLDESMLYLGPKCPALLGLLLLELLNWTFRPPAVQPEAILQAAALHASSAPTCSRVGEVGIFVGEIRQAPGYHNQLLDELFSRAGRSVKRFSLERLFPLSPFASCRG